MDSANINSSEPGSLKPYLKYDVSLALWIGLQKSWVRFAFVEFVEGISIHRWFRYLATFSLEVLRMFIIKAMYFLFAQTLLGWCLQGQPPKLYIKVISNNWVHIRYAVMRRKQWTWRKSKFGWQAVVLAICYMKQEIRHRISHRATVCHWFKILTGRNSTEVFLRDSPQYLSRNQWCLWRSAILNGTWYLNPLKTPEMYKNTVK